LHQFDQWGGGKKFEYFHDCSFSGPFEDGLGWQITWNANPKTMSITIVKTMIIFFEFIPSPP
jgi:hypothetical protein